jgi:drug/metabolite transporter (DMT)-like permease
MLKTALLRRLPTISDVTKGALYMTVAAFLFSLMNTLVRVASADLPPLEIAFFRNLFALASMLPWMLSSKFPGFDTRHLKLHLARAVVGVFAMGLWFTSIALVPLADAVALNFTMPLFIVVGAATILGEKVGLRRWSAAAIGFLGMLVILRPGIAEVSPVMVLPVAAAALWATSILILKHMSATVRAGTSVLYVNLLMTPLSLVPAAFVWTWPHWEDFFVLPAIGLLAMLAHLALARALAAADASAIMPFDYARLPFIALFAFVLFGEVAEVWTWIGGAIIAGSAFYIARRESVLAKQRDATPPIAPVAPDL